MKKLLLLLLIIPLVFGSCSKDDDDTPPSLNKTEWAGKNNDIDVNMRFSELECVMTGTLGNSSLSSGYSYTYNHPKVRMIPKESGNAILEGTISGDYKTMVLVNTSKGTTIGTLTKK